MLFTILISVVGALFFSARMLWVKLRFLITGGKREKEETQKMPLVIFTDSKRYWNTFEPICRELDQLGQETWYMSASPDDPAYQTNFEHIHTQFIGEDNKAFAKMNFLNADVVLSTTPGLDVYQWKRSKLVKYYVHIPHACSDITLYRMFGLDYYDAVLLSGEYQEKQIRDLEELRKLPAKELELVGVPYMDEMRKRLEKAEQQDLCDRGIDEAVQDEKKQRTVLLAPSWGPSSILNRYGAGILKALLGTGYHVIVRPHPQSWTSEKEMLGELMKQFPANNRMEWNRDNDNFDVLRRSDLMISDFSGVIFDFALVYDKPVIYADTTFDKGVYDAYWLKDELWTFETLPKIGRSLQEENFDHLKEFMDSCIDDETLQKGREAARRETWCNPGEGARRTAEYLVRKIQCLQSENEAGSIRK